MIRTRGPYDASEALTGRHGAAGSGPDGVASGGMPLLEADGEPVPALGGGPVGPRLGRDRPGRAGMLEVVADDGRGAQGVLEIRGGELVAVIGGVLPDARQAVGLQLDANR